MVMTTKFAFLWLMLAGGASQTLVGGAPLEPDPKLAAIAPEQCLWYVSYSGMGAADPNSANETEKLFAEPQVQRFAAEIELQIMTAVRRFGGPDREERALASAAPKLVKALIARPFAAYVENVRPGDDGKVDVEAALVLNTGERCAEVESAVDELTALAQEKGLLAEGAGGPGEKWRQIKTPPNAPEAWIGWQNEYLIVAVGKDTSAKVVKRMDGAAPSGS